MIKEDDYYDLDGNKICDKNGYTNNDLHVIDINDDECKENIYHNFYIDNLHGGYFHYGGLLFDIEGNIYNNEEEIHDSYNGELSEVNKVYVHDSDSNIHYIDRLLYLQNIFRHIILYLFHKIQYHFNSVMYYIYRRN